jgi:hypothetical protein
MGMTDRELMQMAMDALKKFYYEYDLIQSLEKRLAQPEREWAELTNDEIREQMTEEFDWVLSEANSCDEPAITFARLVEAKLKEKNT